MDKISEIELKDLLEKFNVRYTDDFFGRWEKVDPIPA